MNNETVEVFPPLYSHRQLHVYIVYMMGHIMLLLIFNYCIYILLGCHIYCVLYMVNNFYNVSFAMVFCTLQTS